MKNIWRMGATAFAITLALGTEANAITIGYAGTVVTWTAPITGTYIIEAIGAQGGYGPIDGSSFQGGRGAEIIGSFNFIVGTVLQLAVGGQGSSFAGNYDGGGGGGSFVVDSFNNPLLIAGGGGGVRAYAFQNGSDASVTEYAKQARSPWNSENLKSTGLGQGGITSGYEWGGGGGGFYSDGAVDVAGIGKDWANGLAAELASTLHTATPPGDSAAAAAAVLGAEGVVGAVATQVATGDGLPAAVARSTAASINRLHLGSDMALA